MKGGESYVYQIQLAAGQYLGAVVEQRGIDVAVTVIAPDGKPLMEVDSPNGSLGPESIGVVAEAAGNYRIDVHSLEESTPRGRYEIRILELRPATARDRALQQARKLMAQSAQSKTDGHDDEAL